MVMVSDVDRENIEVNNGDCRHRKSPQFPRLSCHVVHPSSTPAMEIGVAIRLSNQ